MERKWLARLSMLLSMAMLAGLVGVWRASGARAGGPLVTVGVDLTSASLRSATYELIVTNRGGTDAEKVVVTDVVPRGARFVSARPAPLHDSDCANRGFRERPGAVCRWIIPKVAPGSESRIRVDFDLAPIRQSRKIANEALAAYGAAAYSSHVNDRLRVTSTKVDVTGPCASTRLSAHEAVGYVKARSLTAGRPVERVWQARLDCGADGESPRLMAAASAAAAPSCIDVDPEATTSAAGSEVALVAVVTDGEATNRTGAESANDSCSGVGQNGVNVIFTIEDDNPDAYISRVESFPTDGNPNTQTGTTDESGQTGIGVRLADPATADAENPNRVSGRIDGTPDVPESGSSSLCGVPPPVGPGSCPGQAANEDDVAITWAAGPTGGATGTESPAATDSATPTGSPAPTGTATTTASPTATSTGTARPTGSPAPTRSATGSQSARTITLFTSSTKARYRSRLTLSGQVFSSNASCDDVGETVRIRKRVHGRSSFVDAAAASTDVDGRYSVQVQALQSADYVAVAPAHDQCAEATSPSVTVLVPVKVGAKPSPRRLDKGSKFRITGKVVPKHSGVVKLQRKKGRRWVGAGRTRLTKRSSYVFRKRAKWKGRRAFRVVWPAQDDEHEKGMSKKFVVRSS